MYFNPISLSVMVESKGVFLEVCVLIGMAGLIRTVNEEEKKNGSQCKVQYKLLNINKKM